MGVPITWHIPIGLLRYIQTILTGVCKDRTTFDPAVTEIEYRILFYPGTRDPSLSRFLFY